jgi:tol-pal system protein YbgF
LPEEKPKEVVSPGGEKEKTEPPQTVVAKPVDEIGLYDYSLAAFREDRYEKAMEGFREFLAAYPKSDRGDNAQFWIGECYMALKQYEQAILAYQKVIKNYPTGNKVANAMLRQAIAFLEIKDKTSATLLLKRIIKNYPNSSEADIAKKKLETLK